MLFRFGMEYQVPFQHVLNALSLPTGVYPYFCFLRELQQLMNNLRLRSDKAEEELSETKEQLQQKLSQEAKGETRQESELIKGLRKELAYLKEELRASREKVSPIQERPSLVSIEDLQRQHEQYLEKVGTSLTISLDVLRVCSTINRFMVLLHEGASALPRGRSKSCNNTERESRENCILRGITCRSVIHPGSL